MSRRKPSEPTPYVEYVIRIPLLVEEFISNFVAEENKKRVNDTDKLNNEALVNFIVRDWFINANAPLIAKAASDNAIRGLVVETTKAYDRALKAK